MKRPIKENEVIELRKYVALGSLFIGDYRNPYVNKFDTFDFFDGYLDYLGEIMEEDGIKDSEFWEHVGLYDTNEELINWFY